MLKNQRKIIILSTIMNITTIIFLSYIIIKESFLCEIISVSFHYNGGTYSKNLIIFLVLCFFIMALMMFLSNFLLKDKKNFFERLLIIFFAIFILIDIKQTIIRTMYAKKLLISSFYTSMEDRITNIFQDVYLFARTCRKLFPKRQDAILLTDIDIRKEEGFGIYDRLSYYLYPIDIRLHNKKNLNDVTLLIAYKKNNALEILPSNFTIKYKATTNNFKAIKK